jgi:rhamnogalacturonyl hydrolase YesR
MAYKRKFSSISPIKATVVLSSLLLTVSSFASDEIYKKATIKKLADKVREYRNKSIKNPNRHNWVFGTYYTGLMAMYESTSDDAYLNQCLEYGEACNWAIPDKTDAEWDSTFYSFVFGQVWYGCYQEKKEKSILAPTFSFLKDPVKLTPVTEPSKWYLENCGIRFVDGLYFSPPLFAMLYHYSGDKKYLEWMDTCYWDTSDALYDEVEGLFYRDVTFKKGVKMDPVDKSDPAFERLTTSTEKQISKNGTKVFWSRGNGWAFGGLVRILTYLPEEYPTYERYKKQYLKMAATLKACQQRDGFWRTNLADPEEYDMKESSGTAFMTYGISWGINNGLLPKRAYLPAVKKGWAAIASVVTEEGKVEWGQPPGVGPAPVSRESSNTHTAGIFLLAASEVYKLGL